jgi:hypothetical protein
MAAITAQCIRTSPAQRHRVTRVVSQRTVEGNVGQGTVAALPSDEGELPLEAGDNARLVRNPPMLIRLLIGAVAGRMCAHDRQSRVLDAL